MKLTVPTLLMAGLGMLLIWSGITDRNPIAVLRAILTGQPIPTGHAPIGEAIGEGIREGARAVKPE